MRRTKRQISALALAVLLAGCGSTASIEDQQAAARAGGDDVIITEDGEIIGTDGEVIGSDGEIVGGSDGSVGVGTSSGVAEGTSSGSGAVTAAGDSGGDGGKLTASAPGVTATEVKIGLVYDKSAGTLNTAMGFGGIGQIDHRRAYDTLIADINKRGGLMGRKLVPVYHVLDSAGSDASTPPEVLEQRMCTTFTENRVFLTTYGGLETFTRCMNAAGIIRISNGGIDSQLLAESPLLVNLGITLDRAGRVTAGRLADRGFFKKGRGSETNVKIGIVRYDDPEYARAAAAIKEELGKKGLKVSGEAAIKRAETIDQIQDEANAARAAGLKFKGDGITNVMFVSPGNAMLEIQFMQAAEKQLYRPRYGLNSNSGGQALAVILGSDAQNQLGESMTVGWFPIFDAERSQYSGSNTTPAFQRCIKLLEESGERFTEGDPTRNKEAVAALFCDDFNYIFGAGNAAGANLTAETFMKRGVPSIDRLDSSATYILATNKRRDAYGGVRDGKWVDSCGCYRFESQQIHPV